MAASFLAKRKPYYISEPQEYLSLFLARPKSTRKRRMSHGGLLSLCHAAFYGIGAYAYTLLALIIPAVLSAIVITAALALLISFPALRFRADLFVFVEYLKFFPG
jgi:VIT1/CCC1 family predicted Fe2+/Mn2+ transporter